ncbi:MAG: tRNA (adenosine(37)-N6)-threonylcarbamoyltransferase complex dimerization subunit type 1 TsaB [Clostridia bacterium]|nr:tRNA (adenosine(37)-N6)-threonylcarbamoyltransferase complex dimerization subunit type 1 TsaB [Clostridia bacterium]
MSLILAIDTSAKPVSCALIQEDKILAAYYSNTGLTHSQTLLPMVEHVLHTADVTVDALDAVAVNAGPGSFTGVRIGVSAVKGIAFARQKPCIAVSTLEAMAQPLSVVGDTLICCVMDARCQQVYTALFQKNEEGACIRLSEDEAVSLETLKERLLSANRPVMLVGDGSELCYTYLRDTVPNLQMAPPPVRYQNAAGTAVSAMAKWRAGDTVSAAELLPVYLRLPQAERELRAKLGQSKE